MRGLSRLRRFLLIAPVGFLAFISQPVDASQAGVSVTVFNNQTLWNEYNESPPIPPSTPIVGTTTQTDVVHNFDAEPLFGMTEDFVVKYEGFITVPSSAQISFMALADDGVKMFIGEQQIIDDWFDKGGGGSISSIVAFEADISMPFLLWFYENGGGAFIDLWWDFGGEWGPIPEWAFTVAPVPTTTTSTTTTTLEPSTTTEPATTTTEPPMTTLEPTTTTLAPSTTIPDTTTTTVEIWESTTTTNMPTPISATSTTSSSTSSTTTTTTTTILPVTTSTPETTSPVSTLEIVENVPPSSSTMVATSRRTKDGGGEFSLELAEGVTPEQARVVVVATIAGMILPTPTTASRKRN